MEDVRRDFIQFLTVKQGLGSHTVVVYRSKFDVFFGWLGQRPLDKVSVEGFFLYLRDKGYGNQTINVYYCFLKQLHQYYIDREKPIDFLAGFKYLKIRRPEIEVLTEKQMENIITCTVPYGRYTSYNSKQVTEHNSKVYGTACLFLAHTGCRRDEMRNLRVQDVILSQGRAIFVDTKNGERRNAYFFEPITSRLAELMKGKKPTDYVFTTITGEQIHATSFGEDLKKRATLCGVTQSVHPHIFRHTYGTMLYLATHDLGLVQVMLGHKDIKSTQIYVHIADEVMKKGAMLHPLNRETIDPRYRIELIAQKLTDEKLDQDSKFDGEKVRQLIHQFTEGLYNCVRTSAVLILLVLCEPHLA